MGVHFPSLYNAIANTDTDTVVTYTMCFYVEIKHLRALGPGCREPPSIIDPIRDSSRFNTRLARIVLHRFISTYILCPVPFGFIYPLSLMLVSACLPLSKFVNHLFNSQQLSNKALLAGHLAFYQYHHAASKRGNMTLGSAYAEDAVTWPSQFVSHARHDGTCRVTNDEVHREISDEPDTFFPRCWDVSSGRLSSLLRAFGIAAAVALLRNLANDEVRIRS